MILKDNLSKIEEKWLKSCEACTLACKMCDLINMMKTQIDNFDLTPENFKKIKKLLEKQNNADVLKLYQEILEKFPNNLSSTAMQIFKTAIVSLMTEYNKREKKQEKESQEQENTTFVMPDEEEKLKKDTTINGLTFRKGTKLFFLKNKVYQGDVIKGQVYNGVKIPVKSNWHHIYGFCLEKDAVLNGEKFKKDRWLTITKKDKIKYTKFEYPKDYAIFFGATEGKLKKSDIKELKKKLFKFEGVEWEFKIKDDILICIKRS